MVFQQPAKNNNNQRPNNSPYLVKKDHKLDYSMIITFALDVQNGFPNLAGLFSSMLSPQ